MAITSSLAVAFRSTTPPSRPGATRIMLSLLVLAGIARTAHGAFTCSNPAVLGGEPPIVHREPAANAANALETSPCLPFPHPGGELYFSWKPPRLANYLIAARPLGSRANLALALWQGCPQANGSCVAGADASGPGEPEVIRVRAGGGANPAEYLILVDGAAGGEPLIEVEVRVEELDSPDLEVADARAAGPQGFQFALQSFRSVWEADQQGLRVLGLASSQALDALASEGLGVRSIPLVEAGPLQGPQPEPPTLRFDRFRYDHGDRREVRVYLEVDGGEQGNPPRVFLGGDSDDLEELKLAWDGERYVSSEPVPLTPLKTERFDGRFTAGAGDFLVALTQDSRLPGDPAGTALAIAMLKGRQPLGLLEVSVDPNLSPPAPETPGRVPGEAPRPVGAIADGEGAMAFLGADQLVYLPPSRRELEELLARYQARVIEKGGGPAQDPHQLVRFDPQAVDLEDLEVMLELLGGEGEVRVSSPEMLHLLALFAEESLRGAGATPNFLIEYQGHPRSNEEPRAGGPFNPFDTGVGEDCLLGLQRSWLYLSLFDRDREDGHSVPVAVIDSNFCPFPADEVEVIGGHNFASGEDTPYGTGRTFGQGGGFHGTHMASLIGARHGNGTGTAGTGGQVADLLLYNLSGFGYLFEGDNAIRRAVRDGARVINISWTIPCKIFGINFCKPGHFFRCAVIIGVVGRVAAFIVTAGGATLPPGTAIVICGLIVGMLSRAHNQLEDAVAFAEESDVVVVAAAGNPIGPFGVSPVERFQLIPAMFESVVTVGATDGAYQNTMFYGRAVDVWTREFMSSYGPDSGDGCPPFRLDQPGGSSTSTALVSGIVAMIRAVNPALSVGQVRNILTSSVVDTPGGDPRVRAFLRADRAVMAAGALAGLPDPRDPAFRFPGLGFDEDGPDVPSHYRPGGSCRGPDDSPSWPRNLRPANDEPAAAVEVPFGLGGPGLAAWGLPDAGLHRHTGLGDMEEDWYAIRAQDPPTCEVFDLEVTVEWLHGGGAMRIASEVAATSSTVVGSGTSETTFRLEDVWMDRDLLFEVTGDDNLYELEVRLAGRRFVPPDRFEPNQSPASAVPLPRAGLEFRETRSGFWRTFELEVPDLNFHCPSDADFFRVRLPEADETCLELEVCGGERTETLCAELRITGAEEIRILNLDFEDVTPPGRPLTILTPRTVGLSEFYVAFVSSGREARGYSPLFRYRVPREGADEGLEEWFDEWRCCALREMRDCRTPPDEDEEGGRIGADLLDLARIALPASFSFDAFCPFELCDPAASEYHLIDLRRPAETDLEMLIRAEEGLREEVLVEVVDLDFRVVGRGEMVPSGPGLGGGGGVNQDGSEGLPGHWRLRLDQLPEGIYFLRLRGLERGEVYQVETRNPLPSLEPPAPGPLFRRGDSNDDGRVDLSDAVNTLNSLFAGGAEIRCPDAADANDDDAVNISDPIYALNHLFLGGPELPAPGLKACGPDPDPSRLPPCRTRSCGP